MAENEVEHWRQLVYTLQSENTALRRRLHARNVRMEVRSLEGFRTLTAVGARVLRLFLGIYLGVEPPDPLFPLECYECNDVIAEEAFCPMLNRFALFVYPALASMEGLFQDLHDVSLAAIEAGIDSLIHIWDFGGKAVCLFDTTHASSVLLARA
jgi:hypothetical protein